MTIFNFSAGPAVLPKEVLQQAAHEMLDWHGSGMSVMEMSHRGAEFESIIQAAEADLRELLEVPANYKILFMQGGGIAENAIVPLNLCASKEAVADYIVTGAWSIKSAQEARKYVHVNVAADNENHGHRVSVPDVDSWKLSESPAYIHLCTNETIHGIEYNEAPDLAQKGYGNIPLVADMSSHILSRPINVASYGVIYAGAQKNIGPAGLTILIVRDDLLDRASSLCPSVFTWSAVAEADSMLNTPPTYAIYIAGLVFQWIKRQGGLAAMEQRNKAKAKCLYDFLDASEFYTSYVQPAYRSRMNVPFFLKDESLNAIFLTEAKAQGLVQLKGHKILGGMRASIYNAMPLEGVQALINFMYEFECRHG